MIGFSETHLRNPSGICAWLHQFSILNRSMSLGSSQQMGRTQACFTPIQMFNSSNAQENGRRGGSIKSSKKQRAARANGKKGGRPAASVFFMDQLLNESIHPSQFKYVLKAYAALYESEKQELKEHFGFTDIMNEPYMGESKLRRPPKRIRLSHRKISTGFQVLSVCCPSPQSLRCGIQRT